MHFISNVTCFYINIFLKQFKGSRSREVAKTEIKMRHLILLLGFIYGSTSQEQNEGTRIVGGREVNIDTAAFIVLLMIQGRPLCGGSIISHNFVLTVS